MFFKHFPLKSGRLLDVGCGDGVFLKEAQKTGFEVWGIDFDSKSIKVCQEKWGLKNIFAMHPHEFAEFCEKEGLKFDVITFFEVFEHQDDPAGFLEIIKSMLKPGGYIAGSVPNRDSWMIKPVRKIYPKRDRPPHHFLRFSKIALIYTFQSIGLKEVFVTSTPVKISDLTPIFQTLLIGNRINKKLRKTIAKSEYAGEGTILFKKLPLWRRLVFKGLKILRNSIFFLPATIVRIRNEGLSLYFQGILEKHNI